MKDSKENKALLEKVFAASIRHLLAKIESGGATAAELTVAAKLLKDNNITIPVGGDPNVDALRQRLPFQTPDEIEDERQGSVQ